MYYNSKKGVVTIEIFLELSKIKINIYGNKLFHSYHLQLDVLSFVEKLMTKFLEVFELVFNKDLHSQLIPRDMETPCIHLRRFGWHASQTRPNRCEMTLEGLHFIGFSYVLIDCRTAFEKVTNNEGQVVKYKREQILKAK